MYSPETCHVCGHPGYVVSGGEWICLARYRGKPCALRPATPTTHAPAPVATAPAALPADATGGAAMRYECAEIARRGAVVAYKQMADARNSRRAVLTYSDCMKAVGKALGECEKMIRALPLPAPPATPAAPATEAKCEVCETERNERGFCKCDEAWDRPRAGASEGECAGPFVSAFDCPVHDPRKASRPTPPPAPPAPSPVEGAREARRCLIKTLAADNEIAVGDIQVYTEMDPVDGSTQFVVSDPKRERRYDTPEEAVDDLLAAERAAKGGA